MNSSVLTIQELERMIAETEAGGMYSRDGQLDAYRQLLATMQREQRLREALAWYADHNNYDWEGRLLQNAKAPRRQPPLLDCGSHARNELYRNE